MAITLAVLRPPVAVAQRSPFAGECVVAETLAGSLAALGMSIGLAWAGRELLGPHGGEDPGLAGALTGFFVGTAVGSAVGVHLAARHMGLPARFWEALGGGVAGTLLLLALPLDADEPVFWVGAYALPSITAMLTSSAGSASRMRVTTRATADGLHVGLRVSF